MHNFIVRIEGAIQQLKALEAFLSGFDLPMQQLPPTLDGGAWYFNFEDRFNEMAFEYGLIMELDPRQDRQLTAFVWVSLIRNDDEMIELMSCADGTWNLAVDEERLNSLESFRDRLMAVVSGTDLDEEQAYGVIRMAVQIYTTYKSGGSVN